MKKVIKRVLSMVLVCVLVGGVLPSMPATAAVAFDGGNGTQASPYLISTAAQLDAVRNNLSAHYMLTVDIDLASWGNWEPIGDNSTANDSSRFNGVFDGNNHVIKNMTVDIQDSNGSIVCAGLFGFVSEGEIKNLGIVNGNVSTSSWAYAGGIAGFAYYSSVSNCYNTGAVSTSSSCAGGIAGFAYYSSISNCYNTGTVSASSSSSSSSSSYAGGIAGGGDSSSISNCYNTGTVSATTTSSTSSSAYAGGIAGRAYSSSPISNCYYLDDIANAVGNGGGKLTNVVALTESEMKQQGSFVGFDFDSTWAIHYALNDGYPYLIGMLPGSEGDIAAPSGTTISLQAIREACTVGEFLVLGADVTPVDGPSDLQGFVTWSCSDPNAVRFENQIVYDTRSQGFPTCGAYATAHWLKEGTYKITATTADGASSSREITIGEEGIPESDGLFEFHSTVRSQTLMVGDDYSLMVRFADPSRRTEADLNDISFVIENPEAWGDAEYQKHINGADSYTRITLCDAKEGYHRLRVNDTKTGESAIVPLVVNKRTDNTYTIYNVPIEKYSVPVTGMETANFRCFSGMQIANYYAAPNSDSTKFTLSFDVYNTLPLWGIVEVYDANGTLKDAVLIDRNPKNLFTGSEGFFEFGNNLGTALMNLHLFDDMRNELHTAKTPIVIHDVPLGGSIRITNAPYESGIVTALNMFNIFTGAYKAAKKIEGAPIATSSEGMGAIVNALLQETNKDILNQVNELPKRIAAKIYPSDELPTLIVESIYLNNAESFTKWFDSAMSAFAEIDFDEILLDISLSLGFSAIDAGLNYLTSGATGKVFALGEMFDVACQGWEFIRATDSGYIEIQVPIDSKGRTSGGVGVESVTELSDDVALQVYTMASAQDFCDAMIASGGTVPSKLTDYTDDQLTMYNISLLKNGKETQPTGTVTVSIRIPDKYKPLMQAFLSIYRVESDGSLTLMQAEIQGDYLVFEADHFCWFAIVNSAESAYTVTFDPNGGAGGPAPLTAPMGSKVAVHAAQPHPTRSGYSFIGWTYEPDLSNVRFYIPFDVAVEDEFTEDTTLYAWWFENLVLNVPKNTTPVSLIPNWFGFEERLRGYCFAFTPTESGNYSFSIQGDEEAFFASYNHGEGTWSGQNAAFTKLTAGQTYYYMALTKKSSGSFNVSVSRATFTVALDANSGTVSPASITVTDGGTYSALPTPTRSGYTFDGWYTALTGGTKVNKTDKVSLAEDITLYARWKENEPEKPEFSQSEYIVKYRGTLQLEATGGTKPYRYSVPDPTGANTTIDENTGLITSHKDFYGKVGSVKVEVTDANGKRATCIVETKPSFGQWLIIILLFGWIWY